MSKPTSIAVKNKGSALIIALVFLLVMTLIGTTAMQGTSQQENMAGNMRDRNLAFQAAESALREAGGIVMSPNFVMPARESADPGTPNVNNPDAYNWGAATPYSRTLNGIIAQPTYVIRWVRPLGTGLSAVYRVTARGQGGTADAIVVLQTTIFRDDG